MQNGRYRPRNPNVEFFMPACSAAVRTNRLVLVTARKRAENIQDVPIAITAFSAANLRDMGFKNLSNVASQTPSNRTGGFDIPTLGLPGGNDGIGFNSYGDPRTYGMGVRYRWGDNWHRRPRCCW
jgi:outer membrane receptor protein involved in Fe transport